MQLRWTGDWKNLSKVRDYLLHHSDTADVVETICKAASERFEEHTQLSLEVYRDPEIRDEYLTLYVRQENYDDEQLFNTIDEVSAFRGRFFGAACTEYCQKGVVLLVSS